MTVIDTDREAFMRTIRQHPAADLPRLVFADYLEEQGEAEWAEFIRLQIELSRPTLGPDGTGDSQLRYEIEMRCWGLWQANRLEWFDDEGDSSYHASDAYEIRIRQNERYDDDVRLLVRRGFVAEVADTLAGHIGGECQRCNRRGWHRVPANSLLLVCEVCRGNGLVAGRLRDLRTRHPIDTVRVTDKRPATDDNPTRFFWVGGDVRDLSYFLPYEVWGMIDGNIMYPGRPSLFNKYFHTEESAVESLSQALLSLTNPEPDACLS